MSEFVTVAKAEDVEPGTGTVVEVNGARAALFNVDGEFYAMDNTCTHRGGPLGEGALENSTVTCPWHGAQFNVASGEVKGPPATESVPAYEVKVEDGEVKIAV